MNFLFWVSIKNPFEKGFFVIRRFSFIKNTHLNGKQNLSNAKRMTSDKFKTRILNQLIRDNYKFNTIELFAKQY